MENLIDNVYSMIAIGIIVPVGIFTVFTILQTA